MKNIDALAEKMNSSEINKHNCKDFRVQPQIITISSSRNRKVRKILQKQLEACYVKHK